MTVLTLDEIRAYCEARSIAMEAAKADRVYFDQCPDGCRVHVGQFGDAADAAFDRVRRGLGADASVDEAPGHLFGPAEFTSAVVLMGFVMTFGWDGIWVPAHGEYLMAVNDDRFIDFAVRGGGGRWDVARQELFDNLSFRHWPQMTQRYCPSAGPDPSAEKAD